MPITNEDVINQIETDIFDNVNGLITPFRVRRALNVIREYINDSAYTNSDNLQNVTDRGAITDKVIESAGVKINNLASLVSNFLSIDSAGNIIVNPDFSPEDFLRTDAGNAMLGKLRMGGNFIENIPYIRPQSEFTIYDAIDLTAFLVGNGYRYLGDKTGYSIVDFSNAADGSVPGGKIGFGLNTQSLSGRWGRLLFNLLSSNQNYQYPDASGIVSLILNTAYGVEWSGDTIHSPSADVLYNEIEILKSIIASGETVATVFDASTETTFPSGGSATSKYRVVNSGANPSVVQGISLETDDTFYPKTSTPGPVAIDWYVIQANGDYVSKTLADGKILVGSSAAVATARTPSGAVTITNAGVFGLVASFVLATIMTGVATVTATPILDGESMLVWFNKIQSQITAMSALLTPVSPGNTGLKYIMTIINGTKVYEALDDVNGANFAAQTKLTAGIATDWVDGIYVGTVSGAITGTKGGQMFYEQDLTDLNWYFYLSTYDNIFYRVQDYKASKKTVAVSAAALTLSASGFYSFTGATAIWTLPTVTGNTDKVYYVKNRGTGNLTINTAAGNDIYSSSAVATYVLTPGMAIILQNDGTYYNVQ